MLDLKRALIALFIWLALFITAHSAEIDVAWIKGQSNANPNSESRALSPTVPAGKVLKYQDGALSDGNDPVGPGDGGSAWPSFGETYYRLTGHLLCFVPTAVGSSAMVPAADTGTGNWSRSGTLYPASLKAYRGAIAALKAKGYTIGRRFVIDVHGENDAIAIEAGKITAKQFRAAKQHMIARDRANLGNWELPFYFSLLGMPGDDPVLNHPGWVAVQQQQKAICAADEHTKIPFWKAASFPARGMQHQPGLHYMQAGNNEMGSEMAQNIVAGVSLPCAPALH